MVEDPRSETSPFGRQEARRAPDVKETDHFTVAREFPLRYVLHPSEDSVSLYFLDRRIDLRAEAVPLVKAMLKRREFSARTAMQLLGQGFEWKDVKPALQELVNAGALHVAQQSEKKNALRTPQ